MNKFITAILLFLVLALEITAQTYYQKQKFNPSSRNSQDYLEPINVSNNILLVGAWGHDYDALGQNSMNESGAVFIFERDSSNTWIEIQKIVANDRSAGDYFGASVSIVNNHIIVGSSSDDDSNVPGKVKSDAGSAYIFKKNSMGKWIQHQKIVASDRNVGDQFGRSVSIWNNHILVGAPIAGNSSGPAGATKWLGKTYFFDLDTNGYFIEKQIISPLIPHDSAFFGMRLIIDQNIAVITAPNDRWDTASSNWLKDAGSVYSYEMDTNGVWSQTQKITSSDRGKDELFGYSLSYFNSKLVVGCVYDYEDSLGLNPIGNAGSAFVYDRKTNGKWVQKQKLSSSSRRIVDFMGHSVAVKDSLIIVGLIGHPFDSNGNNYVQAAGALLVFKLDNNGHWIEHQKLIAKKRNASDWTGHQVILTDDNQIVTTAIRQDYDSTESNYILDAGALYSFQICQPEFYNRTLHVCRGDSIKIFGEYHSTEGLYYDTLTALSSGCDSIVCAQYSNATL